MSAAVHGVSHKNCPYLQTKQEAYKIAHSGPTGALLCLVRQQTLDRKGCIHLPVW